MKPACFVGFDASNYTTSIAVCDINGTVIANLKAPLKVASGERGLRQSDALFAHVKNLPELSDKLSFVLHDYSPVAVGCSTRPRSVEGSYMPCFLAGITAAHAFAAESDIPIYEFSHQDGHIKAAYYSSGADIKGDFVAFHVSGGTTEVVYVDRREKDYHVTLIGGSRDLNAGQCIDRTGVMMGLQFPCGLSMDEYALSNEKKLPAIKVSVDGFHCDLSGVENLCAKLYRETNDIPFVSAYAFEYISRTLYKMTDNLRITYPNLPIIYAGGVMSSLYIGNRLKNNRDNIYFATPEYSSDNAAGIALLCREKHIEKGLTADWY